MFGDVGHGFALFSVGGMLCLLSPILKGRAPDAILEMRYLILMLGLFACFCGLMYNDFMSIPLNIFESCYPLKERAEGEDIEMV